MESVKKALKEVLPASSPLTSKRGGTMTKATGCPIDQMKHSLTAGRQGPILLQDTVLLEKLMHFDREKIPPRNVHALGTGAYGSLTITNDISQYSCAKVFSKVGMKTDIFVRFSGIFTEVGDADTVRDPRGFAIKFYTTEGNWDLLSINTPAFNVRDIKMGPDAIHAFKRDPRTGSWNPEQLWDFVVNHPESLHQTLMIFTDKSGTPMSFRGMNAYSCNTFSFYNDKKERFWVKFHILSELEMRGFNREEAKLIAGEDPNFLHRDLKEAIDAGRHPKWRFCCQVMPEQEGYKHPWTFDCTKIWKHRDYPLIDIGTITLDRNPTDYASEVEQAAFSPANVVPGIGFSPDRLLQGRIFLYDDTQFHRLGSNFKQLPINLPHVRPSTYYVGGGHQMEFGISKFPHYYPSSCEGAPKPAESFGEPPICCDGQGGFYDLPNAETDEDFYLQSREFLGVQSKEELRHLACNIASNLAKVSDELAEKVCCHLSKIDKKFSETICSERKKCKEEKAGCSQGEKLWHEVCDKLANDSFEKHPVE